jgi:HAMP domain-containing protein
MTDTCKCPSCSIAQRLVAETDRTHACTVCGMRWEPHCAGCVDARAHLERQRDAHGHRNPKAWVRCDECGEIVAVDERGMQSALDVTVHAEAAAEQRLRRKRLLDDLDNLAQWRPYLEGHSTEPSPIVGDGNVGGGAKISATDRPDWVNDNGDGLKRALATRERIAKFDADARAAARARANGSSPTPLERAAAVLRWLSERSGAAHRKELAFRIGMAFGGRGEARVAALADLRARLELVPLTSEQIAARRVEIDAVFRADTDDAEAERKRVMAATDYAGLARAVAIAGCDSATASAYVRRTRALEALHAEIAKGERALTPATYRAEVAKLPSEPTEEGVKLLGNELLRLADALWSGLPLASVSELRHTLAVASG